MKSKFSGLFLGLHLNIYIPGNYFVYIIITDNNEKTTLNKLYNQRIEIQTEVFLKLDKIVDRKLPKPYTICENDIDTTIYKEIVNSNIKYTKEFCLTFCFSKKMSQNFNCTSPNIYENKLYPNACDLDSVKNEYSNDFLSECNPQCPLECESTSFPYSSYVYQSRTQNIFNINYQFGIHLYFEASRYTVISQIAKTTLPDIVSIVGGTLGLFLGLSLLSFVEIFDFIMEAVFLLKETCKKRTKIFNFK